MSKDGLIPILINRPHHFIHLCPFKLGHEISLLSEMALTITQQEFTLLSQSPPVLKARATSNYAVWDTVRTSMTQCQAINLIVCLFVIAETNEAQSQLE